ncbi:MAG TPA: serine/threonine-protein kinase [Kofleriaceae bacterium]|nr:serine/threonine-protein kinase [Kofleriaceae bacterium]
MSADRYPKAGTVLLGKYRVEAVVGEGGMGAVIKAWHLDLEEPVALKILLPEMMDRKEIVTRFTREAKAAVKLKGEHVARVLDVGRLEPDADGHFDGTPYIAMEFLEGADLNQIVKAHGPQEASLACDMMLQACEAIAEAHSLGIIHRDIKSSNFFITQAEDQPPHLKVLDFGIATPPKTTSDLTDGESVIGTPAYMAPEQMRSSRQADARSDIWSMGVVLYELLEGRKPFRSEAYSDLCLKVGMDPPDAMVHPDVPEALRAVVMKCLEKTVERRYQSAAELAFDLLPFASDPVRARASVEQTARLLSRRGTRAFDASRAPDDVTPGAGPKRLTPPAQPAQQSPISESHPSGLTPAPGVPIFDPNAQRTPTSNGQMSPLVTPKRRGVVVAASFATVIVLAGGGALLFGGKKHPPAAATRPADPQPTEMTETKVEEPATPVQVKETPVEVPAAGSADVAETGSADEGSAANTGSATEKKVIKKRGTGGRVIKKNDDPFGRR